MFSGYLDDEAEFICNCLANPKGLDIYRRCIKRDIRPLRGRTGFRIDKFYKYFIPTGYGLYTIFTKIAVKSTS
jgi:hypothetical protein